MYTQKAKYDRCSTNISVGTIGPTGHGKTTLTAAITKFLAISGNARCDSYDILAKGGIWQGSLNTRTVPTRHIDYETASRYWTHIDCPGDLRYAKNMIVGAAQMDAAILVVSAVDFVAQQVDEHVRLAKYAGVQQILVFINKCELAEKPPINNPGIIDVVETAVREILNEHKLDGYNTVVIRGSALAAMEASVRGDESVQSRIRDLIDALESYIHRPPHDIDLPFLMAIGKAYDIPGCGVAVTGKIHRGKVRVGDEVDILGIHQTKKTIVTGLEVFNHYLEQGQAGYYVACMLRGVKLNEVKRGQVLAQPGSTTPRFRFQADIDVCHTSQGGRHTPFSNNYRPQIYIKTASIPGSVSMSDGVAMMMPGDSQMVDIKLDKPVWIESGMLFSAREGGKTVFTGVVRDILR